MAGGRLADQQGDPHTPLMGFLHAHVGWVVRRDAEDGRDYRQLVPDVSGQDPWLRVLDRGARPGTDLAPPS